MSANGTNPIPGSGVAEAIQHLYSYDLAIGALVTCLALSLITNYVLLKSVLSVKDMLTSIAVALGSLNERLNQGH